MLATMEDMADEEADRALTMALDIRQVVLHHTDGIHNRLPHMMTLSAKGRRATALPEHRQLAVGLASLQASDLAPWADIFMETAEPARPIDGVTHHRHLRTNGNMTLVLVQVLQPAVITTVVHPHLPPHTNPQAMAVRVDDENLTCKPSFAFHHLRMASFE
jgi:hypothetical protein